MSEIAEDYYQELGEIAESETGYVWYGTDSLGRDFKLESYEATPPEVERELFDAGIHLSYLKNRTAGRQKRHLPKHRELAGFARNFGEQIEAGNTPLSIIEMLADAEVNQTFKEALKGAYNALQNGRRLHEAFEMQRDHKERPVFPRELISALEIGESIGAGLNRDTGKKESGLLVTLNRFAEGQEKADQIKSSIRSAMMYPLIVAVTAIGAIAAVTIFVMPIMKGMYEALLQGKADTKLPFLTRVMIALSEFVWSPLGALTIIAGIIAGILFIKWWKSPGGQEFKGRRIIFLPGVGGFYRMLYASQLLRYLSMLAAGVGDIKEQLKLAAETTHNPVYREMLEHIGYQYRVQGKAMTVMFKPYLMLFGREFLSALLTADKTGDASAPFHRYAQVLEIRANRQLETVLTIMKNAIIFPLGIIVALVVAAIILPFFELAGRLAG